MKADMILLLILLITSSITFADESVSWQKLTDDAFALYKEGNYKESITVTKKALDIAKQQFGPESLQAAESTGNLSALYYTQGNDVEAKKLSENAQFIRKKHGMTGVPLGLQTEAFFDRVERARQENAERTKKKGEPIEPQMELRH